MLLNKLSVPIKIILPILISFLPTMGQANNLSINYSGTVSNTEHDTCIVFNGTSCTTFRWADVPSINPSSGIQLAPGDIFKASFNYNPGVQASDVYSYSYFQSANFLSGITGSEFSTASVSFPISPFNFESGSYSITNEMFEGGYSLQIQSIFSDSSWSATQTLRLSNYNGKTHDQLVPPTSLNINDFQYAYFQIGFFNKSNGDSLYAYGNLSNLALSPSDVAAVPEPETYALMLAGLGALGFIARRRKSL